MVEKVLPKESDEKGRRFKKFFEIIAFSFLLAILVAPGLFYTDVMAHEFYHYAQHQDIAEEICIDVNKPYGGYVKIIFENQEELLKYESERIDEEEQNAELFGHIASLLYLINALVVVNWMLMLVVRRQKEKWG